MEVRALKRESELRQKLVELFSEQDEDESPLYGDSYSELPPQVIAHFLIESLDSLFYAMANNDEWE